MQDMRILVYTPMTPKTKPDDPLQVRIFGRSLQSILRLEWEHEIDYVFARDDTPEIDEKYQHIAYRYNQARIMALEGSYDALLTVESDIIVPPDALKLMTAVDADIVYPLVMSRGAKKYTLAKDAWRGGWDLWMDDPTFYDRWGEVLPVFGVGMACTLIHSHVLNEISFRCEPGPGLGRNQPNDFYFALDCKEAGFKSAGHTGVQLGHITTRPVPQIIWPNQDPDNHYLLEYLPGVVVVPIKEDTGIPIGPDGVEVISVNEARRAGVPVMED